MALRMDSEFFSFSNLAEWTPMTTSSLAYFFSSFSMSGMMWMQLMQQSVQKSSRTTLPFRALRLSGLPVLSQAVPPSSSGAFMSLRAAGGSSSSLGFGLSWANARAAPAAAASPMPNTRASRRERKGLGKAGSDMEEGLRTGGKERQVSYLGTPQTGTRFCGRRDGRYC